MTSKQEGQIANAIEASLDDLLVNDTELASVFGMGRVLLRDPEGETRPITSPTKYVSSVAQKFETMSENFSNVSTRASFFKETQVAANSQTTVEYIYENNKKVIVMEVEKNAFKSSFPIKMQGLTINIPLINKGYATQVLQRFKILLLHTLEELHDTLEGLGHELNIPETAIKLRRKVRGIVEQHVPDQKRRVCQEEICSYIIAAVYLATRKEELISCFHVEDLVTDSFSEGAYIRVDDADYTYKDRLESMIHENSIGYNNRTEYSLSLKQVNCLLTYIFSGDSRARVEAKVSLLSSATSATRTDLLTRPGHVLQACFREYCLTREEILQLFFSSDGERKSPVCVCCGKQGSLIHTRVDHPACNAMKWLEENYQFVATSTTTYTHRYHYVKPGVAKVARDLARVQKRIGQLPYIGTNDKEVVAYTLDSQSMPRKIGSAGVRWNYPHTSTGSTSQKR